MPPSQSDCRGTGYHAISSWHCVPTASKIRFTGGRTSCPIAKLSPVARPYCRKSHLVGKTNRVGAGPTRLYQPAVATYRKPCL